jgi:splicing factor U2AF subunit
MRSRSRSQDRKKTRRDKSPLPIRTSGKWDEGFGGVYLPTTGQSATDTVTSNLAATLPTVGPLAERKLIVNGIPKTKSAKEVVDEFASSILSATGHASQSGIIFPVVSCQFLTAVGATRNAMVEFRTPQSASVAMICMSETYKIKRPRDFPSTLDSLGGLTRETLAGLSTEEIGGAGTSEGPVSSTSLVSTETRGGDLSTSWNRLSVYGLPGNLFTDQIVKDLFSQFGKIRAVSFVKDPVTSLVKAATSGFVEYDDPSDAAFAESVLNGFPCGNSVVKIQRVEPPKSTAAVEAAVAPRRAPLAASIAGSVTARVLGNPALASQIKQSRELGSRPSLVVQLLNAIYAEDIADDGDYNDIVKEVKEEAAKFGHVESIKIPRPSASNPNPAGVGKIFVQFVDLTSARKFQQEMNGRMFDGNRVICAAFYPIDRYVQGKYVLYHD